MADKKITALTAVNSLSQNDVFVVVTSTASTPITKKIVARDIFKGISFTPSVGSLTGAAIAATLSSSVDSTSTANSILSGGRFDATLNSSGNTHNQYGILSISTLVGPTANIVTEHAGGKFVVDVANTVDSAAKTSGIIVAFANTVARVANTYAFIDLREASSVHNQTTKYLLTASGVSQNTTAGNTLVVLSSAVSSTVNAKLKIRVNNTDYWILLADDAD
jgi:hypothetical protein